MIIFPIITFLFETGTYFIWILRTFNTDSFIGKFSVLFKLGALGLVLPLALSIVIAPVALKNYKLHKSLINEKNL